MEDQKKEQLRYTFINHDVRNKLGLTLIEYCIADAIYHLSNNPSSKVVGWCYASKEYIADMLGTSRQTIFSNLNKLLSKGLIERDDDTKHVRTTDKWYKCVVLTRMNKDYKETLHTDKKLDTTVKKLDATPTRNLTQDRQETGLNSNIYNNTNNNSNNKEGVAPINEIISYFFDLKGWGNKSKDFYAKNKIIYSRYTKSAKELYFLCDNDIEEVNKCLDIMAKWADSRELDWGIETIFKKWYDIDKLKPKEKKPYYEGNRVFDMAGKKYVLMPNGDKLQFAGSISSLKYK